MNGQHYNLPVRGCTIQFSQHRDRTWSYTYYHGDDEYVHGASGFPSILEMLHHLTGVVVEDVYKTPLLPRPSDLPSVPTTWDRDSDEDKTARRLIDQVFEREG